MLQNALHLLQVARELEDYNTGKDFLNPKGGSEVTHDMTRKWKVMQGLQVIFLTCCLICAAAPFIKQIYMVACNDVAFMSWNDAGS